MTIHGAGPYQAIVLFLIGGPWAVLWGIRKLLLKREIENTPTSKVRSAAMGRLELSGIARARKPLKSPVSGLDCCWWRSRVQELRSNGKNTRWVTIHSMGSIDLFFLEDATGKVLVNPDGADIHALHTTKELNALTRSSLSPVLASWGIDDVNWIGVSKRLRVVEESLPDCAPVYILGSLGPIKDHLQERQHRFRELLRAAKSDTDLMKRADVNGDGSVDAHEWDAFRMDQEKRFLEEELAKPVGPAEENMIVQAPSEGTYLISTGTQEDIAGRYRWLVPISLALGIVATGMGVYWGLAQRWEPLIIVLLVVAGAALGCFFKPKGVRIWGL